MVSLARVFMTWGARALFRFFSWSLFIALSWYSSWAFAHHSLSCISGRNGPSPADEGWGRSSSTYQSSPRGWRLDTDGSSFSRQPSDEIQNLPDPISEEFTGKKAQNAATTQAPPSRTSQKRFEESSPTPTPTSTQKPKSKPSPLPTKKDNEPTQKLL